MKNIIVFSLLAVITLSACSSSTDTSSSDPNMISPENGSDKSTTENATEDLISDSILIEEGAAEIKTVEVLDENGKVVRIEKIDADGNRIFEYQNVSFKYSDLIPVKSGLYTQEDYDYYMENKDECENCEIPSIYFAKGSFLDSFETAVLSDLSVNADDLSALDDLGFSYEYFDINGQNFLKISNEQESDLEISFYANFDKDLVLFRIKDPSNEELLKEILSTIKFL